MAFTWALRIDSTVMWIWIQSMCAGL